MNSTGAMPKKSTCPIFLNLGQTAEDSEMFTNIWLSSIGLSTFPQNGMYLYLSTYVVESTCTCN